ncbi:hypothetical protein ACFL17_09880 [Pseudomonadota bacterium]
MDTHQRLFFFPSFDDQSSHSSELPAFLLLCISLVLLVVIGHLSLDLDHPFKIATNSRALFVDGGFYSDAARNWVQFGQWSFQYDSRHWPGVPFLSVFRALVFSWFGVSLESARLSSIYLSLISCIAFYFIVRTSLKPFVAVALTIAGASTITFVAHARSALAEPTATCFALLAVLVFVRIRNKNIAIPLSLTFAFISFLSKMLFLHILATMVVLWGFELLLRPLLDKQTVEKRAILLFGLSLAGISIIYFAGVYLFRHEMLTYLSYNTGKSPVFHPVVITDIASSLYRLGDHTKAYFFSWAILLSMFWLAGLAFMKNKGRGFRQTVLSMGRAEMAMATWLFIGLVLVGIMRQHKAHYHFFAILPLAFIAVISLKLVIASRFQSAAIGILILAHTSFQIPLYAEWLERTPKTIFVDASREMANIIHQQSEPGIIPVMGEYSAQLALFSDRMLSLDAKWNPLPYLGFCQRLNHWRPKFHVHIVRPRSRSSRMPTWYKTCKFITHLEDVKRYWLHKKTKDEFVLMRIHYRE